MEGRDEKEIRMDDPKALILRDVRCFQGEQRGGLPC